MSSENSDTVAEALKIIRRNYSCHWSPRYILSDQSSIEIKSIKEAFPGINAGEQECEVILCTVHVMRTWMTKIYEKKTCDVMVAAMYKRTKIGCEQLVQDARRALLGRRHRAWLAALSSASSDSTTSLF